MQKLLYKLIVPALLSICFIVITAIVSQSDYSFTPIGRVCFWFNVIPADIGFLGDGSWIMALYYPLLFIILTVLFWWLSHIIKVSFDRLNINRSK